MSRLVKGAFDGPDPLFGIRSSLYKDPEDFVHNGGWYNAAGEKIAYGDLSLKDLGRLAARLEADELFIVLRERDTHQVSRWLREADISDAEELSRKHVAELCVIIIGPERIYCVIPEQYLRPAWSLTILEPLAKLAISCGIAVEGITRKQAREMVLGHDGSRIGRLGYFLRTRFARA